jgi:hypothetical protein
MYVKRLQCNGEMKGLADTCCYNRRTWSVMVGCGMRQLELIVTGMMSGMSCTGTTIG